MSFRVRMTLLATGAVAIAIVFASAGLFVVVRDQLYSGVDNALHNDAEALNARDPSDLEHAVTGPDLSLLGTYPQIVSATGGTEGVKLPVTAQTLKVANGGAGSYYTSATVSGIRVRIFTFPYHGGFRGIAVQVARPLDEVDRAVKRTRTILLIASAAGIGLAAILGLLVSGAAIAPIRRLTRATETVTKTGDLSQRIEVHGKDELSQLATRFNEMLGALEESTRAQRALVADASHELRTPLTSLRTNIEVLARDRPLPPGERERLLDDVVEQLGEMTELINELIELARGEQHASEPEDMRLDLVALAALQRVQRNRPTVTFLTHFEESPMVGVPASLERAIGNLLDNAAKWSPPGGIVDVTVRDGEVLVRDQGPGIADEDLPYVFDRFYRSTAARGMPGSGLGLAIVRQVAHAHGGEVTAEHAEGGGTLMRLRLPVSAPLEPVHSEVTVRVLRATYPAPVSCCPWQAATNTEVLEHDQTSQAVGGRRRGRALRDRGRRSSGRRHPEQLPSGAEQRDRRGRGGPARRQLDAAVRRAQEGAREPGRRGGQRRPTHPGPGDRAEGRASRPATSRSSGSARPAAAHRRSATTGTGPGLDAAATYLGLTQSQLMTQLQSGKSLADVAKANGKTVDGLVAAMVADAKQHIAADVKAGRLTEAQQTQILSDLEQHITDMVNGTMPQRPDFDGPPPGAPQQSSSVGTAA